VRRVFEVHAVGLEGGEIAHELERLRPDAEALVATAVLVVERAGLVEEAQVRSLNVEAHGGDAPLMERKVLEN